MLLERWRDIDMQALVLIVLILMVAIVIAIVATMMVEFCGGLWQRVFLEDLIPPGVQGVGSSP